jgi:hypothetical protein
MPGPRRARFSSQGGLEDSDVLTAGRNDVGRVRRDGGGALPARHIVPLGVDLVVSYTAVDGAVAGVEEEGVVTGVTEEGVIAAEAVEDVVEPGAGENIVAARPTDSMLDDFAIRREVLLQVNPIRS